MLNKYNKLFKQLVSAGLVSPNPAGARWFGQMVARLHAGLVYHNHTAKPYFRSKRVKVKCH
jgi:hypothetical protein